MDETKLPSSAVNLAAIRVEYAFLRLYSIDFDIARETLRIMRRYRKRDVLYALFRDFVVTYSKPFSRNRGPNKTEHALQRKDVPTERKGVHDEIVELRNSLFAHTDFEARQPQLMRWKTSTGYRYPLGFSNPEYDRWIRRYGELHALLEAVDARLTTRISRCEERLELLGDAT